MIPLVLLTPVRYVPGYFLFFSALIVTIRSDLELMLISRFATLFLIPTGFLLSWLNLLPIDVWQSIAGALLGYMFLFIMATLFRLSTGKEGMGQGDLELLAFIGSFTGVLGCWISLLVGSILGSFFGLTYIFVSGKKKNVKIPFGPFLAFGAMSFVLLNDLLSEMLFLNY
jgi:leader peptidase (prepilin peptidase)/N-methyltransferase